MFDLLRMIFLGGSTLLSPPVAYISESPQSFQTKEPLLILNPGAHVLIDISSVIEITDVMTTMAKAEGEFPAGCIMAQAKLLNGNAVNLTRYNVSFSKESISVQLGVPKDMTRNSKIANISISSCKPIPRANVTWSNYSE